MGISIETDPPRRLLTVRYARDVTMEETCSYLGRIETLLADLKPGFRMLTDFSTLASMEAACAPYIEQIMDHCNEHGVSLVVRVIPDPHKDIGFNIMSLFHFSDKVVRVTCNSHDEAAKALED